MLRSSCNLLFLLVLLADLYLARAQVFSFLMCWKSRHQILIGLFILIHACVLFWESWHKGLHCTLASFLTTVDLHMDELIGDSWIRISSYMLSKKERLSEHGERLWIIYLPYHKSVKCEIYLCYRSKVNKEFYIILQLLQLFFLQYITSFFYTISSISEECQGTNKATSWFQCRCSNWITM